ncbi:MAG: UDP-3-O-(3-hydroxymyristoyl)glucosamine N-acyltransferase [Acidobacteriaceae bacterium]
MKIADVVCALTSVLPVELHGDPDGEITGVAGIEQAEAGHLTFVANPKYASLARTTRATAILVGKAFPDVPTATLRTSNPYLLFAHAIRLFYQPPVYAPGIHPSAAVHPTASLGADCHIGAYAVIGENARIGNRAVILPHVVVYPGARIGDDFFAHSHAVVREHCVLGNNVILQNGAVVGADGFGFARNGVLPHQGDWFKIAQSGPTVLEDDVEIQANSCVDRASIGETRIGRGVKIDNLVQVGHGSVVRDNTLLCSQVGLAGSSNIGKDVILAGQVGVAGHCTIGDRVIVTAQSGTHGDIAANRTMSGSPAIDSRQWMRSVAAFNKLPELMRRLREEKQV